MACMNSHSASEYSRSHVAGSTNRLRPLACRGSAARLACALSFPFGHSWAFRSTLFASTALGWLGTDFFLIVAYSSLSRKGPRSTLRSWGRPAVSPGNTEIVLVVRTPLPGSIGYLRQEANKV